MSFGWEDGPYDIVRYHASILQSSQFFPDHEGDSISKVEDTPTDDEIIFENSHHATDDGEILPYSDLGSDMVHKGTNHSLQNFLLPPFPRKEGDSIVEILCGEMMVMSSSQPMNLVLCKVEPYPLLEENDGHTERKVSLTTNFVPFSPFEDNEEVASLIKDLECLPYIEKLNKYL